jgi:hypothetical protein
MHKISRKFPATDLAEFVVDEPVDERRLADPGVADEDDVAVVPGLRQPMPDAAHGNGFPNRVLRIPANCSTARSIRLIYATTMTHLVRTLRELTEN